MRVTYRPDKPRAASSISFNPALVHSILTISRLVQCAFIAIFQPFFAIKAPYSNFSKCGGILIFATIKKISDEQA